MVEWAQASAWRVERIALNEAAFRETNEQIQALNAAGAKLREFEVVCECGAEDCVAVFTVSADRYSDVRAHPDRFLLKPGHEAADVESVVERHRDFDVVEKKPGRPQRLAEETDPRSGDGHDGELARRIGEAEPRLRASN